MAGKNRGGAPRGDLPRLFPDHPVRDGRKVAFKFEGIARTLAGLALNPDNGTPFTVVVRGEWGRGKTTLLAETRRLLDRDGEKEAAEASGRRQVRTLWFNAWKYPAEDTVLAGLLGKLLDEFRTGTLLEQLQGLLEQHKEWLARRFLQAAFPWVFKETEPAGRFSGVEEKRAFYDHFQELFGQLSYVWFHGWEAGRDNFGKRLGAEGAVAVFLDDLDRCREERVLEVMEAINLFLDQPGVCFYLGLDWQRLLKVLEKKAEGDQARFLEKIVQVAVDLPQVTPEGVEAYVGDLIEGTSLAAVLGSEVKTVADVLKSTNPRHAKRFLNDLSIRLGILHDTGHLGDGEAQVPAEAVLSWHLLAEHLPEDAWRRLTASRGNMDAFIRALGAALEKTGGPEAEKVEGADPIVLDLRRKESLRAHIGRILDLAPARRDILVSLGSPPRLDTAPAAAPARAGLYDWSPGSPWWVPVREGSFQMGSNDGGKEERPVHTVRLSPYEISRYPVTNAQYAAYVQDAEVPPPPHWKDGAIPEGKEDHPVVGVSWHDARKFCEWLGGKNRRTVDLPTEAQWEFAARGPGGRTYPWGEEDPAPERANYGNNVGDTTPVNAYPKGATPEGIHDLAGNVWEWCADWFDPGYYARSPRAAPKGPEAGTERVLRGGSWLCSENYCTNYRPGARSQATPDSGLNNTGFRLVKDVPVP